MANTAQSLLSRFRKSSSSSLLRDISTLVIRSRRGANRIEWRFQVFETPLCRRFMKSNRNIIASFASYSSLRNCFQNCRDTFRSAVRKSPTPLTLTYLLTPFLLKVLLTPVSCDDSASNLNRPKNQKDCPIPNMQIINQTQGACGPPCTTNCASATDKNGQSPVDWCEPAELSHKFLVRQACQITVDSVTRILCETVSAYQDYHEKYRCLLDKLIEALEIVRTAQGTQLEVLDCQLILIRSEVEKMKCKILELESFTCSIQRLADATAETAFLGHAEYHSVAMSERVQSVAREMKSIREESLRKERDMIELQSVVIVESGRCLK